MVRLLQIFVLGCLVILLVGCDAAEKEKPVWEQVKIGDLAPSHSGKGPSDQSLKAINFNIYVFELPAEKVTALDDVWQMLYRHPLRFNDYTAFVANSFSVGFGEIKMWNRIGGLLDAAGAKRAPSVSLFLSDGRADDLAVARIYREQTISYASVGGSMVGATVGPGRLVLRIRAKKIPGARGVCYVEVHPVFSPPMRSFVPELATRAKAGELVFASAGFGLNMSPGDFFLLGPGEYISDQVSLSSLFFSKPEGSLFYPKLEGRSTLGKPERKPAIRIFMVLCTSINV